MLGVVPRQSQKHWLGGSGGIASGRCSVTLAATLEPWTPILLNRSFKVSKPLKNVTSGRFVEFPTQGFVTLLCLAKKLLPCFFRR